MTKPIDPNKLTKNLNSIPPKEKYINPFTDYGFKRIFGEEPSKELLKDFLNDLLYEEQGTIEEIQYLNSEQLGDTRHARKAFFDLYCSNEKGERFIVELQKTKQNFFKDRTVYYSTFPIREQAKRGDFWDFELQAVYTIAILDFVFDEDKDKPNKYLYNVKLTDQESQKIFYDKLTFIYLSMPKFTKSLEEIDTHLDKFLYILKNLTKFQRIPDELKDEKFVQLFKLAEVAKLNQQEYYDYEASLKEYWDLNAYYNTAHKDATLTIAKSLKQADMPIEFISQHTGLTLAEIENI